MPEPSDTAERRVVEAPVIYADKGNGAPPEGDGIRIRASVLDEATCVFLVDRPVLPGHSYIANDMTEADESPLAENLFATGGVESLVLHDMTVTVTRDPYAEEDWEPLAKRVGEVIRSHLRGGNPVVSEEWLQSVPPEDAIRDALNGVLEKEINPGIAAHSGHIRLDRVEGNTVYVELQGGCQGCAASQMTLRQGVERLFRDAVPELGRILDVTDHSAGKNPFYTEAPA
jgi:Fe-S cluster biogenesis protein NfuA